LLVLQCALYRDYNENYNQNRKEELHTKKETECPENKEIDILTIRGVIADGDLQLVWMYLIHTGNLFIYSYTPSQDGASIRYTNLGPKKSKPLVRERLGESID
jgi:hypothetical protein